MILPFWRLPRATMAAIGAFTDELFPAHVDREASAVMATVERSAEVSTDQLSVPSVEPTSELLYRAARLIEGFWPIVKRRSVALNYLNDPVVGFVAQLRSRATRFGPEYSDVETGYDMGGRSCAEAAAIFPQHTKHPK